MLKAIKRFFRIRRRVFEVSSENGLVTSYVLGLVRGEGGKPEEKLRKRLECNRASLERRRAMYQKRGVIVPIRRKRA